MATKKLKPSGFSNDKKFKYKWKDKIQSKAGPPHTARHIALVLLDFMDDSGGSCFPSFQLIARRSCLSRRTVYRNINTLVNQGWLRKEQRWISDKNKWKSNTYQAVIPGKLNRVGTESPHPIKTSKKIREIEQKATQNVVQDSDILQEVEGVGTECPKGRDRESPGVGTECHTNTPESIPGSKKNSLPIVGDGKEFYQVPKDEIAKLKAEARKKTAEMQIKTKRQKHGKGKPMSKNIAELQDNLKKQRERHNKKTKFKLKSESESK